jgi:hypothetical protein
MFDPQQALLDLLQPGGTFQTLFPPSSRYHGIPAATLTEADGSIEIYLRRRFLPALESFIALQPYTVTQSERLDHIAFRYLGDPEQFWRIADANTAMNVEDLTASPGRRIQVPFNGAF